MQQRVAFCVLDVYVCPAVDEDLHDLEMVPPYGFVQLRVAACILGVDVSLQLGACTGFDQDI